MAKDAKSEKAKEEDTVNKGRCLQSDWLHTTESPGCIGEQLGATLERYGKEPMANLS